MTTLTKPPRCQPRRASRGLEHASDFAARPPTTLPLRLCDIIASLIGIILLDTGMDHRCSDGAHYLFGGPAFFCRARGPRRHDFLPFKFRTMHVGVKLSEGLARRG